MGIFYNFKAVATVATVIGCLTGCAGTAESFPLNDQARALGPLKIGFERTGVGNGPVSITMASGETLKGHYWVENGGGDAFAFSGGQTASAVVITGGPVQFVATGPSTQMLCRGSSSTFGHGNGQCQTENGAVWAIDW